ncbi:prepilin-type N-terminal cleavage/methylation domain-containing protein, partial [Candidatus Saccharibacteria bacterium]|nr:prepilin-type N-terminal cleavage/methylation domain-containing protein [Candidatus Saccharibacteria bacterium]
MVSSRRINTSGFTIVELLIVIVVIGILAAI